MLAVGETITVVTRPKRNCTKEKNGLVIALNGKHFTVDFGKYRETFLFTDLDSGVFEIIREENNQMDDLDPGVGNQGNTEEKLPRGALLQQAMELLPRERYEQFIEEGKFDKEIADELGIPEHRVKSLKKKYGLVSKTRKPYKLVIGSGTNPPGDDPAKEPDLDPPRTDPNDAAQYCKDITYQHDDPQQFVNCGNKQQQQEIPELYTIEQKLQSIADVIGKIGTDILSIAPEEALSEADFHVFQALEVIISSFVQLKLGDLEKSITELNKQVAKLKDHARYHRHKVQHGLYSGKAVV